MKIRLKSYLIIIFLLTIIPLMSNNEKLRSASKKYTDGLMTYDLQLLKDAKGIYSDIIKTGSMTAAAYSNLAQTDLFISSWDEFSHNLRLAMDNFHENSHMGNFYYLMGYGAIIFEQKDSNNYFEKAIEFYMKDTDNISSLGNISLCYYFLDRVDEGFDFIKKMKLDEKSPNLSKSYSLMVKQPKKDFFDNIKEERRKILNGEKIVLPNLDKNDADNRKKTEKKPSERSKEADLEFKLTIDSIESFRYNNIPEMNQNAINIQLNKEYTNKFEKITSKNIGKILSVSLNNTNLITTEIRCKIGSGYIALSHFKTPEEAKKFMKDLLKDQHDLKLKQ